ncbi:MAG: hypothetical protein BWX85_01224 [Chloroflexi bacterium ADurb.Bin120]|jgi:hypothetical protein|nr:MAG: hypothetical protein BWX85_01224 [Chloroflexi bacterium ADurb.Bin120]
MMPGRTRRHQLRIGVDRGELRLKPVSRKVSFAAEDAIVNDLIIVEA